MGRFKNKIFVDDIIIYIEKNIIFLEKIIIQHNNKEVEWTLSTYLDFVSRTKNNLKGIKSLLNFVPNDEFYLLPINSIMRTISSDMLTFSYLLTFLSKEINFNQITFKNELDSIATEHYFLIKDLKDGNHDIPSFFLNGKNEIKNRKEFHATSDINIIGNNYKFPNNIFLSEKSKFERINYFIEYKLGIYYLLTNENCCTKKHMTDFYFLNKWFTQFYHYNYFNSKLSLKKSNEIYEFELNQIYKCIDSSFIVLKVFSNIFIKSL